jgi:hypothetical protein
MGRASKDRNRQPFTREELRLVPKLWDVIGGRIAASPTSKAQSLFLEADVGPWTLDFRRVYSLRYTAITSRSGSTSCFSIPSIAINVPVNELGQLPQAP